MTASSARRARAILDLVRVLVVAAVAVATLAAWPAAASPAAGIAGLEVWYDLTPLHEHTRDGAEIDRIPDATGNGHDLVAAGAAPPATFRVKAAGGKPAIVLPRYERYAVATPFSLDDFTLALVYRPACRDCGLFRGERPGEDGHGVILRSGGRQDVLRSGTRSIPFGASVALPSDRFSVTILGREGDALREEVDGRDLSAGATWAEPVRLGVFFEVSRSRAVRNDAAGMEIAELLVFSRWLPWEERARLTAALGERYGIEVADLAEPGPAGPVPPTQERSEAWLTLRSAQQLAPGEPVPVNWEVIAKQSRLVRRDHRTPGALGCTRDGTTLRLSFAATVVEPEGVSVRGLFLVNGSRWLPEQAVARDGRVVLEAVAELDAGDVVQTVLIAEPDGGEPAPASIEAEGSYFSAATAEP